ncbi:hypothetical protein WI36_20715 [Burkholderia ubonensis]|uniref:Uncharacterized protein n=1 Tax=Burkholderia ubonensis TaxID=101571 RepID=A0A117XTU8_9BURK|nr:hypothetical protein WI35_20110 [Burkholderia ubonensis]KUZ70909.1 hypothetical protein WI36_20715 [Burkholderia ubonensis]KUZ88415.1 hypothetical protein WI38_19775 [Burkholderia ubonensis]KUZ92154.1 hypothetical protein WI40_24330 [Burkholderia ubonensis]KUZ93858.1 hypothetical protein WI39_00735 [Burkholderia ubonensis]
MLVHRLISPYFLPLGLALFKATLLAFLGRQNLVGAAYSDFAQHLRKRPVQRICIKEFDIDGKFAAGNVFCSVAKRLSVRGIRRAPHYFISMTPLSARIHPIVLQLKKSFDFHVEQAINDSRKE